MSASLPPSLLFFWKQAFRSWRLRSPIRVRRSSERTIIRLGCWADAGIARWVKQRWNGKADTVLLIEEEAAGPLVKLRVTGMLAGVDGNAALF